MALSKKEKNVTMANYQETSSNAINSFANGTEIIGEIKSAGDVRIDGKLKGNINIKGRLVIGNTGVVDGEVNCSNCDVSGKITGKVNVTDLFSLKASAVVEGEVFAKKLAIEPGAVFTVTCKMDDKKTGGLGSTSQSTFQTTDKKDKVESK
jgi:cytoskeletal protein CcmA (bactofilin family)